MGIDFWDKAIRKKMKNVRIPSEKLDGMKTDHM